MNPGQPSAVPAPAGCNPGGKRRGLWLLLPLGLILLLLAVWLWALRVPAEAELHLGDGRILQIEAVTYGQQHQAGRDSLFKRFRPWLPAGLARLLSVDREANHISLDRPGLVVWVNALSAAGGTNVDCQRIRVEFVDRNGDLFGETTSSWFGAADFWRAGHVFYCYPREEPELHLRVTVWGKSQTATTTIKNPHVVPAAIWRGEALPQSQRIGNHEIRLSGLTVATNGQGKTAYYATATRYFVPRIEVLAAGKPATGWEAPDWMAEAANGNRGQFLGVHHDALRFDIAVYPTATNREATEVIMTLPSVDLTTLTTNLWWRRAASADSNAVTALGLFPAGTHTFSEGVYQSSTTTVSGPSGGAPSGWTGSSTQVTPFKRVVLRHHYTPTPVIYLRVPGRGIDSWSTVQSGAETQADRIALRLHDAQGNQWLAQPDDEVDGILPLRLALPAGVIAVTPEVIRLKPLKARFLVSTKLPTAP